MKLTLLKRPKCWLTRHHWLLQSVEEHPADFAEKLKRFHYTCQVCGKKMMQKVWDLDE